MDQPFVHSSLIGCDGPVYPQNVPVGGRAIVITSQGALVMEKMESRLCDYGITEDRWKVVPVVGQEDR